MFFRILYRLFFIFSVIIIAGCSINAAPDVSGTPTLFIITSTLPALPITQATETLLPPAPILIPTNVPIEGVTNTQLNVRAQPSTASQTLGVIEVNSKVEVIGKEPSGTWYQIVYTLGLEGKGWVTGAYVQVNDSALIPLVAFAPASGVGGSGLVIQQINVRTGPATSFDSLGILNVNDVVKLIGRNDTGSWLQVEFAAAPDGKGWITTTYIKAQGFDNLPVVSDSGILIGTATPAGIAPTAVAAMRAILDDGDSQLSPAVSAVFSPSGNRSLIYTSDLSAPEGDKEDWAAFTPYTNSISLKMSCIGSGNAKLNLMRDEFSIVEISCAGNEAVKVESGLLYMVKISMDGTATELSIVRFTIEIRSSSE